MSTKNRLKCFSFLFIIVIMAISCNGKNKKIAEKVPEVKSIFTVPIPDIQIENTTYRIGGGTDTVLSYKSGSKIIVPANAFLDKEGNPVKDEVKLRYREFANAFDVYLAGIPMVYDSAGREQVFETAGMIEINASSQGQPVFPNPQNKIQVEMNSFQSGNEFNVYKLDTVTGKWNYLGKDKVETSDYNKAIAGLPPIPEAPKKARQNAFTIGDMTGRYPELEIYKNVLFDPVDNKYQGFSGTEIKVVDSGNGIYTVTFIMDAYGLKTEQSCKCYLAFKEGVDYDNALQVYRKKYKNLIEKRERKRKEVELLWEKYYDVRQKYADLGLLKYFNKAEVTGLKGEEKIIRTLEINGFGFINCDYPAVYPQGAGLRPKYKDTSGNDLSLNNVVLVEKGRNAIFRYTDKILFNPQKENLLWGITSDNKLAYLKAADFRKITQTSGEYTFTMTVVTGKLKTYEDICKVLF